MNNAFDYTHTVRPGDIEAGSFCVAHGLGEVPERVFVTLIDGRGIARPMNHDVMFDHQGITVAVSKSFEWCGVRIVARMADSHSMNAFWDPDAGKEFFMEGEPIPPPPFLQAIEEL